MKAGRELDALVAEKVMGFTLDYEFADYLGAPTCRELREPLDEWGILPNYSTSIFDAWQVVEKMHERGMWADMRSPFGKGKMDDGYWCGFTPHLTTGWNGRPDFNANAPTMPPAICLAALKAVGVDIEAVLNG